MSIFEIIMLVCFGAAWPFAIAKSWRSRQTGGKSIGFLVIVLIGYLSGVVHKACYSRDPVIFLYALNAIMVSIDILIFLRNRGIELGLRLAISTPVSDGAAPRQNGSDPFSEAAPHNDRTRDS